MQKIWVAIGTGESVTLSKNGLNPVPDDKILALSKLKAFAYGNLIAAEIV